MINVSCKFDNEEKESKINERGIEKKKEKDIHVENDIRNFKYELDSVYKTNFNESKIVHTLINDYFNSNKISKKYDALFCYYLKKKKDESFSESLSLNVFQMFVHNNPKGEHLIDNINTLEISDQEYIYSTIVEMMCIELGDDGYDLYLFEKDFTKLSKIKIARKKFKNCIDNWVE